MGTKITALPQVITPTGTDELAISQDTGLGGRNTYKVTLDQVKSYIGSGGSGSVTNIGVNSTDGSIGVFGSPITNSGTISLTISSVGLDKLDDGGATGGEVLTYNGSTSAWEPGYGGSSGIIPNILVGNGGTTYTLTNYTNNTASNYLVFVGGVAQRPVTDFTISGSSIIFGSSIASGVQILVYSVINIATLNVDSTPIGTVTWFAASAAPTSYLECSGGVVAISDYLDLYYVIGTKYNTGGEGAGNFRIPDLRGEFIRGWDHGRGVDTGRVFGSWQKGTLVTYEVGGNAAVVSLAYESSPNPVPALSVSQSGLGYDAYNLTDYATQARIYALGTTVGNTLPDWGGTNDAGSGTTRPRNIALLPCIKALKTVTGNVSTLNFIEKPASPTNGDVLTFNGSTSTWVASSLSANGFSCSKTTNGYTYLPNGILIQWGKLSATSNSESSVPVTFTIPFPNNCLSVNPSIDVGTWDNLPSFNNMPQLSGITSTGFILYNQSLNTIGGSGTFYYTWQAIGY